MLQSIGKNIRKLRKERNLTQEELAELLGVTSQAVSKWENENGMPDISQIVPLAVVLGVSTDILFGRDLANDDATVEEIIREAEAPLKKDGNDYSEWDCYVAITSALKTYPNHTKLLLKAFSYGCSILMDGQIQNEVQKDQLYAECLHHAELILNYSKDISAVLDTRKWLIYLYCHYGQFENAKEQAGMFPQSMQTQNMMMAWIAASMKNNEEEIHHRCHIFATLLSEIEFQLRTLGDAYRRTQKYAEAMEVYQTILNIVEAVYGDCEYTPPMHCLAWVHFGLAYTSLLMDNDEAAIDWLEKEYEFNIKNARHYNKQSQIPVPSLAGCSFNFFSDHYHLEDLKEEFHYSCFDRLKGNPKFDALLAKVEKL